MRAYDVDEIDYSWINSIIYNVVGTNYLIAITNFLASSVKLSKVHTIH